MDTPARGRVGTTVVENAVESSDTDDDPPAVKASSYSVLLMQKLSRFVLEEDMELLAHQGIKKARDLEYLDNESISSDYWTVYKFFASQSQRNI